MKKIIIFALAMVAGFFITYKYIHSAHAVPSADLVELQRLKLIILPLDQSLQQIQPIYAQNTKVREKLDADFSAAKNAALKNVNADGAKCQIDEDKVAISPKSRATPKCPEIKPADVIAIQHLEIQILSNQNAKVQMESAWQSALTQRQKPWEDFTAAQFRALKDAGVDSSKFILDSDFKVVPIPPATNVLPNQPAGTADSGKFVQPAPTGKPGNK